MAVCVNKRLNGSTSRGAERWFSDFIAQWICCLIILKVFLRKALFLSSLEPLKKFKDSSAILQIFSVFLLIPKDTFFPKIQFQNPTVNQQKIPNNLRIFHSQMCIIPSRDFSLKKKKTQENWKEKFWKKFEEKFIKQIERSKGELKKR
jgi:hypothetical protein